MKKVHVNVGTIGHIDHGKTTLTAAILAVQAARGLAQPRSYGDIARGGIVRDENKTVTIVTSHVHYETAGTGRSSSSEPPTSPARCFCPTGSRW
jgi:elongation factor Tu